MLETLPKISVEEISQIWSEVLDCLGQELDLELDRFTEILRQKKGISLIRRGSKRGYN